MTVTLKPNYQLGKLTLRPNIGTGKLRFGSGSAELKVNLSPFLQGPKGDKGDTGDSASIAHTHYQNTPASVWVIEHNLGFWPNVYVLDTNGDECEGEVSNINFNRTDIHFSAAFAGRARLT